MIEGQPLPAIDDPLDRAFWEKARQGVLVIQACASCGEQRFPPRPMCPHCQSESIAWQEDAGDATVWSFASPRPPLLPAFEAMAPYVTVIGALASNPAIRIAGMVIASDEASPTGLGPGDVAIGQPIQIHFREVAPGCALPFWRLESSSLEYLR
ncbi:MAG: zinc ribbon domain-containing protein [Sphingomonas sp.]|jgi:hypothetical protein|uniref:Zn-ribbon domain-containing OB-fold protein n=1 Tax=Sphingomonas sp. TaxID=28214 RepID=UPI0035695952